MPVSSSDTSTAQVVREVVTTRPSLPMRAVSAFLRLRGKRRGRVETLRQDYLARHYPEPPPAPRRLLRRCDVVSRQVAGWPVYEVTPKAHRSAKRIIYLHGGSYAHQIRRYHWHAAGALAAATGARVTLPVYPLAPEHDHRASFALMGEVFADALQDTAPEDFVLCGDSAGAGLALGFAVSQRDAGTPLPGRLILFAPWLDVTMADPAAQAVEPCDRMLRIDMLRETGLWWAGDRDPRDPLISPLFADLSGLPPVDIYQGTADVFIVDTRTFAQRAASEGARVRLFEFTGAFHAFAVLPVLPESRDIYRRIARDLRDA